MASEIESAVVIGDGPSPEGMAWGGAIDAQHRVVRLYNHQWQRMEDYGTRYDHGLITKSTDPWRAWRKPALSWFFYNGARERGVETINDTAVVMLDHEKWRRRALALGAVPHSKSLKLTRGFVAAAGTIETLKPRRLYLIGMDMMREGATTSPRYAAAASAWRDVVYPGVPQEILERGAPREGPHDYGIERAVLLELAAAAGTEIAWGF